MIVIPIAGDAIWAPVPLVGDQRMIPGSGRIGRCVKPAADRPRGAAEAAGATPGTLESTATSGPGRSGR